MRLRRIAAGVLALALGFHAPAWGDVGAYEDTAPEVYEAEGFYAGDEYAEEETAEEESFQDAGVYEAEAGEGYDREAELGGSFVDTEAGAVVEEAEEIGPETAAEEAAPVDDGDSAADEPAFSQEEALPPSDGAWETAPISLEGGDNEPAFVEGYEEALQMLEAELNAEAEEAIELRASAKGKRRRDLMTGVSEGAELALGLGVSPETGEEALVGAGSETSRFSLMEADSYGRRYVHPAPNQKENGSCWAYAATAAAETSAAAALGADVSAVDDSETYVTLFTHSLRNGEGPVEHAVSADGAVREEAVNPFLAGGSALEAAALLVSARGPAREEALPPMPVSGEEILRMSGLSGSYRFDDSSLLAGHVVTDVDCLPEPNTYNRYGIWTGFNPAGRAAIRDALAKGHAVTVDIFYPGRNTAYMNAEKNCLYVDGNDEYSTHQVLIVGWDDTFSRTNFKGTPEGDGAWICRNSWGNYEDDYKARYEEEAAAHLAELWPGLAGSGTAGEDGSLTLTIGEETLTIKENELSDEEKTALLARWLFARSAYPFDENGCFYMSYYDRVYHSPTVFHTARRSGFAGEGLLQYDYLGMANVTAPEHSEASGTEANVFSLGADTDICRVGVVTGEAASTVKVELYLLGSGAETPVDGELVSTKETLCRWAGYHLVDLDRPVTLPAGCRFSAVVTIKGPTGHPYTPYEYGGRDPYQTEYEYIAAPFPEGESFILKGSTWTDMGKYTPDPEAFYLEGVYPGNACIKVYTAPASAAPLPLPDGKQPVSFAGRSFSPLLFRWKKSAGSAVTLRWKKTSGADGFTVFGGECGRRVQALKDLGGDKGSVKLRGLKKNTCYRYYLERYTMAGSVRVVTARSPYIYVTTAGGRYTNCASVKLSSKKTVRIRTGQTAAIAAYEVKKRKAGKRLRKKGLRYESSDSSVAAVSSAGKIRAKKKGEAQIYVYAQNGVYAVIRVRVA